MYKKYIKIKQFTPISERPTFLPIKIAHSLFVRTENMSGCVVLQRGSAFLSVYLRAWEIEWNHLKLLEK